MRASRLYACVVALCFFAIANGGTATEIVPPAPECKTVRSDTTTTDVSCVLEVSSGYPQVLEINCTYPGNTTDISGWQEIPDSATNNVTITLRNLTEFKIYTCEACVSNAVGDRSDIFYFNFTSGGNTTNCTKQKPECDIKSTNWSSASITCNVESQEECPSWETLGLICSPDYNETREELMRYNSSVDVYLTDLDVFQNYTCQIFLNGSAGVSESTYLNFTTIGEVYPPSDVKFIYLDDHTYNVTWTNVEIPIRQTYWIRIQGLGKLRNSHFIEEKCAAALDLQQSSTTVGYFVFSDALPDFGYNVSIFSETPAGNGPTVSTILETNATASQPPQNVTVTHEEFLESPNNLTFRATIYWSTPCNTNGPALYFVVSLEGVYSENSGIKDLRSCQKNYQNDTRNYACTIDVAASTFYNGSITLIGEDELVGLPANLTSFRSPDNCKQMFTVNVTSDMFTLSWTEPTNRPGKIWNYSVSVDSLGPGYPPVPNCNYYSGTKNYTTKGNIWNHTYDGAYPYFNYVVRVEANTIRGRGPPALYNLTTEGLAPANVENYKSYEIQTRRNDNESYEVTALMKFTPSCFANGPNIQLRLDYTATRPGCPTISETVTKDATAQFSIDLRPEYTYRYSVSSTNTFSANSTDIHTFVSPSGVPKIDSTVVLSEVQTGETQVNLVLKKSDFDDTRGDVKYLAIIVSNENVTGGAFGNWDSVVWPEPRGNAAIYYQASKPFWTPWSENDTVQFVLGSDDQCTGEQFCNRPLTSGTRYYIIVRVFTADFYRNNWPVSLETEATSSVQLILKIIFGLLGFALLGLTLFILWRKGIIKNLIEKKPQEPLREIPIKKFVEYCKRLEENPDELKSQYTELCEESKLICESMETVFARKPENKRKNRYTNILPYDHTRVRLNIDEDDEMCTDYINASYIKGFSGEAEYIATQGPLPSTCRDFWKMVLQENISMIVMVSRFIENNKEKCYKYFPNNHEHMQIGDDIEVRCCTELHFGIYCVRGLQVKKDLKQLSVTHMQFLEWPDFGVPSDTENMLLFCHQFQERWKYTGGMAIVHCSAGVGRTGTLIAMDILLRTIKAGKNINVFNTVLELRKQRINMVQTEKQYMYIYSLIKSIIEHPACDEEYIEEHFYENVDVNNSLQNTLLKENIVETPL
ncbi:tyrosine-protein phosphatase 10D-like isoform X2 [Cylas formicarius]|uniref:tyrosine-protein phosphatase 10D-like isoform X2 n=1 Tax=Cylas formicarius TaxID=197179 RepID=UPI00295866FF|nr:tyrosine-protein phosphatase 10D-like isoform X2 [Cylas formicarius]